MRISAPIKHLFSVSRKMVDPSAFNGEEVYHYSLPLWHETGTGAVEKSGDLASGKLLLEGGEILVSKLNPEKGAVILAAKHELPTICSPEFIALKPHTINRRYAYYLMLSAPVRRQLQASVESVTNSHKRARVDRFLASRVNIPDHNTQKAIADFLEREIVRMGQQIEKKSRFISLLKEKRSAIITHAVTKGIDPDVPMKDSGLDWLGTMPAHWHIVPPTALFTESKERAREGDQMLSATQKYGVMPLAQYEELEQRQVTLAVTNLEKRKHVEIGDFVISMRSMDGGLERARASGSVRSSYSVLKPGPHVEGRFYGALLKSSLYIQALRLTSNFIRDGQDMNFSHFRRVRLPKLDIREQAAIADYVETETRRIDSLMTLTQRSIDRLHEFRSALITAAVTGQINVATWGKRGETDRRLEQIAEELAAEGRHGDPVEARA